MKVCTQNDKTTYFIVYPEIILRLFHGRGDSPFKQWVEPVDSMLVEVERNKEI